MHISTKIAGRLLLGGRDAGTSKFTGIIAIIGMAVGCIALIISISVLNGFEKKVTEKKKNKSWSFFGWLFGGK